MDKQVIAALITTFIEEHFSANDLRHTVDDDVFSSFSIIGVTDVRIDSESIEEFRSVVTFDAEARFEYDDISKDYFPEGLRKIKGSAIIQNDGDRPSVVKVTIS